MAISIQIWFNMIVEYEWDQAKEQVNIRKHGYTFTEAIESFQDQQGVQLIDMKHSTSTEKRFYWVGKVKSGTILTVWFTRRKTKIRIIGCAEWRKFRSFYYEGTKIK
jgi:uncharacterized DUF497 family protein